MDGNQDLAVAVLIATFLGAIGAILGAAGVFFQWRVARRQANLQEASAYRDQAKIWQGMDQDWQVFLLVSHGPDGATWFGLDQSSRNKYRKALQAQRDHKLAWHRWARTADEAGGGEVPDFEEAESDPLSEYYPPVRRIFVHLSQVSDLLFRRRISVHALYDAIGHDLIRERDTIIRMTRLPSDAGDCPGPVHMESDLWSTMTLDQISARIGWFGSYSGSGVVAQRILALLDYMVLYAESAGNVTWIGDHTAADAISRSPYIAYRIRSISQISLRSSWEFCWLAAKSTHDMYRPEARRFVRALFWVARLGLMRPGRTALLALSSRTRGAHDATDVRLTPVLDEG